ncbi:hypothetical protein, partial [Klebsiella pneumoniae]|uniref:hypothetical protein n=2 Tax=Klebsiella pneumoniae TaxID=573 RepID=UPI00312E0D65
GCEGVGYKIPNIQKRYLKKPYLPTFFIFFLCDRGRTVFQKLSFSFCATVVAQFLKATILVFRGKGVPPKSAPLRHPHTKHLLDNKLHRWQANAAGGA